MTAQQTWVNQIKSKKDPHCEFDNNNNGKFLFSLSFFRINRDDLLNFRFHILSPLWIKTENNFSVPSLMSASFLRPIIENYMLLWNSTCSNLQSFSCAKCNTFTAKNEQTERSMKLWKLSNYCWGSWCDDDPISDLIDWLSGSALRTSSRTHWKVYH